MQDSNFANIFSTFSRQEKQAFKRFLRSPYHNRYQRVLDLYIFIEKEVEKQAAFPSRTAAYAHLFPEKAFHANAFNALLSELVKLAEAFLLQEALRKNEATSEHLLRKELLERGLLKRFDRRHRNFTKRLDSSQRQGFDFQEASFQAKLDLYHHEEKKWKEKHDRYTVHLQNLMDDWDRLYLMRRLFFTYEMANLSQIVRDYRFDKEQLRPIKELAVYLTNKKAEPIIDIFRKAIDSLEKLDKRQLLELESLIQQNRQRIPKEELRDIYTLVINIAIRAALSSGDVEATRHFFFQHVFELYLQMDEDGVLFYKNVVSTIRLKNVIAIGLKIKELSLSMALLEKYRRYIKEGVYFLNLANIRYHKKDYTEASDLLLTLLQGQKIDDHHIRDARHLQIKILFDQAGDEFSQYLVDTVNSFKAYINTNKAVSTINKKAYRNFCTALLLLHRIRTGNSSKHLADFELRLAKYKEISDMAWLRVRGNS